MYPRELALSICEGIAAQRKLDKLGLQSRPIMNLEDMLAVSKGDDAAGTPRESLHEAAGEGLVAWDDVSGQELDPSKVRKHAAKRWPTSTKPTCTQKYPSKSAG